MKSKRYKYTIRYYLMILVMAILVFLCVDTKYYYAFGDYIFNFFHIKAWSSGDSGTHLTLFYIFPIVLILFVILKNIIAPKANIMGWKGLVTFLLLIFLMVNVTNFAVELSKIYSDDLTSIIMGEERSSLEYKVENGKLKYFEAKFQFENLSKDLRVFEVALSNPFDDGDSFIYILDSSEEPAKFHLSGKSSPIITIDSDDYQIDGNFGSLNGGGSSQQFIIRLKDTDGKTYDVNIGKIRGLLL